MLSILLRAKFASQRCLGLVAASWFALGIASPAAASDLTAELQSLAPSDAVALLELGDRWKEIVVDDRTLPTPFSQFGIEVVTASLVRIYALPPDLRDETLDQLRAGDLSHLLPAEALERHCAEVALVAAAVEAGGTAPIEAKLSAEVVHAGPVLDAIGTELPSMLAAIGQLPDRAPSAILAELRNALLTALELQRARSAIDAIAAADGAGSKLLRRALEQSVLAGRSLEEVFGVLPDAGHPRVSLCGDDTTWPSLPHVDDAVRAQWAQLKSAVNEFYGEAEEHLAAIRDEAYKLASAVPPLTKVIDPLRDLVAGGDAASLIKSWRVVFAFTPGGKNDDLGSVKLLAVNESIGLELPLGVRFENVRRVILPGDVTQLTFVPDDVLQFVKLNGKEFQSTLDNMGLSGWVEVRKLESGIVESDFSKITVNVTLVIPALGTEVPFELTLHDAAIPIDLGAELKKVADRLAEKIAERLLSSAPTLSTGWGDVELTVSNVAVVRLVDGGRWEIEVRGKLNSPFDDGSLIEVELGLGTQGAPFRLRAANLGEGLYSRLRDHVNTALNLAIEATDVAIPEDAAHYLRRCLTVDSVEAGRGSSGEPLSLFVSISTGAEASGGQHRLELSPANVGDFATALLNTMVDSLGECIEREWEAFLARAVLQLSEEQIAAYVAELETLSVNWLGTTFSIGEVRRPAGKFGFQLELVAMVAGEEIRFGGVEVKLDLWQPGGLLSYAVLDFSAANIEPADIRRLLIAAIGIPSELLDQIEVAVRGGAFVVRMNLSIDALGGAFALPPLEIGLGMSGEELKQSVLAAVNTVIAEVIEEKLGEILSDLGPVESATLDSAASVLLPLGGSDARIVLGVTTNLHGVRVLWTVTVTIDPQGRSSVKVDTGNVLDGLESIVVGKLTDLLQGIAPGGVEQIRILTEPPYGIAFDVKADVGNFRVILKDIRITVEGVSVSPVLHLEYEVSPGIPIPPFFQAPRVAMTIDLENLGNFEIGAWITVQADEYGVIGLDARLRGKGAEKRLETEGVVKILRFMPLAKTSGAVDFREGTIVMRSELVGELSKLLSLGREITITTKPLAAEMSAGVGVLGLRAEGRLRIEAAGDKVVVKLHGNADLALGEASLDVVLDSRLRGSSARGTVKTFIADASIEVSPAVAKAELDFRGFRIKLITPSVTMLTEDLLREAVERVFDFKLSWDSIKNREIIISLLDSSGRQVTDPVGGDPIDGEAPEDLPADGGSPPPPIEDASEGGHGDGVDMGGSLAGCGLEGSVMMHFEGTFPGHVVEVTKAPPPNLWYYYNDSRVAPLDVWATIKNLKQIACFRVSGLDLPFFEPVPEFVVASQWVQVLMRTDGGIIALVWRKDQRPVDVEIDNWIEQILIDGSGASSLLGAIEAGFVLEGYARQLLKLLVREAIDRSFEEKMINARKVPNDLLVAAGLPKANGAIALMESKGERFLRVVVERGESVIASWDPLFARLDDIEERAGPLAQLTIAAFADGQNLTVIAESDECVVLEVDGASGLPAWTGRLFVAGPAFLEAIELIEPWSTIDSIRAAKAGKTLCDSFASGINSASWDVLVAGEIDSEENYAFAFGKALKSAEWEAMLIHRHPSTSDVASVLSGAAIEAALAQWEQDGLLRDPLLMQTPPLSVEGRRLFLHTLTLPEESYLDRLLVNPRGLF